MTNSNIIVELYSAKWCGYCKDLKPAWNEVKKKLDEKGIKYKEYDADDDADKIPKDDFRGFPTIRLINGDNITTYAGDRTVNDIMEFVNSKGTLTEIKGGNPQNNNKYQQCGGNPKKSNDSRYFEMKANKYKGKYIKLRDSLGLKGGAKGKNNKNKDIVQNKQYWEKKYHKYKGKYQDLTNKMQ